MSGNAERGTRNAERTAALLAAVLFSTMSARAAETPAEKFFHEQVAPILTANCLECHNSNTRKGGLSLESLAEAQTGGEEGPAVVPGKVDDSLLIGKITAAAGDVPEMPQKKPPLSAGDVAKIRRWIADGAAWPKQFVLKERAKADKSWWSLRPLVAPEPPSPANIPAAWRANPIDRFVFAKLAEKGLTPNPPADPRDFIRRVTYDLTGLPPTPEEVEEFHKAATGVRGDADRDRRSRLYDDACATLVDRLLASPRYGERWGRHWLDVVRFGESNGYERNVPIGNVWPFRDYVIRSLNDDKPFDRFIQEHLAGDVLGRDDPQADTGTVFLVCGPYDNVGNQDPVAQKRIRADALDDMISAVGGAFLGLTVNCTRCHDHKFDPLRQTDYYRLSATFDGVTHGERPIGTRTEREAARRYEQDVVGPLTARRDAITKEIGELESAVVKRHAAELARKPESYPQPAVAVAVNEDQFAPHEARYLRFTVFNKRGDAASVRDTLIEEIEVWSDEKTPRNVALASAGGRARVAGQRPAEDNPEAYGAPHLIDGQYGGKWSSDDDATAILEWPRPERIGRVTFSTERLTAMVEPRRTNSSVGDYRIETSLDGRTWRTVVESARTRPPLSPAHARARVVRLFASAAERERLASLRAELADVADRLPPFNERIERLAIEQAALRARLKTRKPDDPAAADERRQLTETTAKLDRLRGLAAEVPVVPTVFAGKFAQPKQATVVYRGGDVTKPGESVVPGSPSVLSEVTRGYDLPADAPESERRLALARWLTADDNPLVPRVLANRVWHYHFGTGIVDTPSDLGYMGGKPTHPELLDWLAARLKTHGWRLKALHREIVLSQTYRQSGDYREAAARIDGDSRLLWRFPPRRLSAEEIRDTLLDVAGVLDESRRGGPGFRLFHAAQDNVVTYIPLDEHSPQTYRRAVYHQHVRAGRFDLLTDFDLPDSAMAAPRRSSTTTPLQAFTLLNHSFSLDMAEALAKRLERDARSDDVGRQVVRGFELCYGRPPQTDEAQVAVDFVKRFGASAWCRALFNTSEFLYVR